MNAVSSGETSPSARATVYSARSPACATSSGTGSRCIRRGYWTRRANRAPRRTLLPSGGMLIRTGHTGDGAVDAGPPLTLVVDGASLAFADRAVVVATARDAVAYRQRDHVLARLAAGSHE